MNQDFNTFQNPSFSKETYKEESNEQISAKLDNIDKNIVELCNGINAIEEAVNLILSEVKNKRNAETIVETKEESVQEEPVTFERIERFEPAFDIKETDNTKVENASFEMPVVNEVKTEEPVETLNLDGMISIDSLLKQEEVVPSVSTFEEQAKVASPQPTYEEEVPSKVAEIIDINIPNAFGDGRQRSVALDLNSHNTLLNKKDTMTLTLERAA